MKILPDYRHNGGAWRSWSDAEFAARWREDIIYGSEACPDARRRAQELARLIRPVGDPTSLLGDMNIHRMEPNND